MPSVTYRSDERKTHRYSMDQVEIIAATRYWLCEKAGTKKQANPAAMLITVANQYQVDGLSTKPLKKYPYPNNTSQKPPRWDMILFNIGVDS